MSARMSASARTHCGAVATTTANNTSNISGKSIQPLLHSNPLLVLVIIYTHTRRQVIMEVIYF